jgi:hypothetical protein
MTSWLRTAAGVRNAIGPGGLVIGRSSACAIVVDEPDVSRRHVLVLPDGERCLVIPLGNRSAEAASIEAGGSFRVGSAEFVFERAPAPAHARWMIRIGSTSYPLAAPTTTIGGANADLIVDGLPEAACVVHAAEHVVVVETFDAEPLAMTTAGKVTVCGVELELQQIGSREPTTVVEQLPSSVIVEVVPKGVVLRLRVGTTDHTVFLPQLRGDLALALLRPASPARAGDFIDDEVVLQAMYGRAGGTRQQLNLTIHRARITLTSAGLVGPILIQRAPGGGATRFRLAQGATVSVV